MCSLQHHHCNKTRDGTEYYKELHATLDEISDTPSKTQKQLKTE